MFLYRKNIILVPTDYDGKSLTKGLLSVDCYENKSQCNFKAYNLDYENGLVLGVAVNNRLYKHNLTEKDFKNFYFDIPQTIKNTDDISCVLIQIKNTDYQIVLWGSTEINSQWKSMLELMLEDNFEKKEEIVSQSSLQAKKLQPQDESQNLGHEFFGRNPKFEQQEKTFEHHENDFEQKPCKFDDELHAQSHENIADFEQSEKTEIYSYKDEEINALIDKVIDMTDKDENSNIKKDPSEMLFYERISGQIDKMFRDNKAEQVLNEILPNSKFCRVDFEDGSGYYVFGIIYDDGLPKYLCYGLPAQRDSQPPTELSNLYQWLPIDANDDEGDGYYMMYQDANTGKNISVEII